MMPPLSEATRPLMWNISAVWLMYVLFAAAIACFAFGIYKRVEFWRRGKEDKERFADWGTRLKILFREVFLQKQVRNSGYPSILHSFIFYSFAVLFVTTLIIMVQYDMNHLFGLQISIFQGFVYVFFSVASELAGLLILVGVGMALYRRWVREPETLPDTGENSIVLLLIAGMVVTGYWVEGMRIAYLGDPWSPLSFVGAIFAKLSPRVDPDTAGTLHASVWWLHTALALGWIAAIPYTKFVHLLSLPTNVFFSKLKPRGELEREDIESLMESSEDEEDFQVGIQKADEFTWKQRLDLDACVSCGRCDEVCPAYIADKEYFSARQLIARLKNSLDELEADRERNPEEATEVSDIVGKVFDEEFVWHCRTCSACMEVCPALIEHVDTLMEVRRNEVLIQGRVPEEAGQALRLFENNGNPFGSQSDREEWIQNTGIRVVAPGEKVDVLYWIGCVVAFDPQKHKIAEDLCRLMRRCGIDFGVLGGDEKCCGDPARIMGQEMLFQMAAKEQLELIRQREFKVLLTGCPHCYNVLKHEYRQFGADFKVVHHTEFIQEMLESKGLKPGCTENSKVVFHDPCYLGRYQKIYDPPRRILDRILHIRRMEMVNHHAKSLCCGAGGGHYFMDLKRGERINNLRVSQAHAAGADTIVTGCGFCMHMLQDSVKLLNYDESMKVIDIASLVAETMNEE